MPLGPTRKPCMERGANQLRYVAELINPATGDWDIELVKETFCEADCKEILKIPVHQGLQNVLALFPDPKGIFTVRSTYKLCRESMLLQRPRGGSGSASGQNGAQDKLWNGIWKCPVPN